MSTGYRIPPRLKDACETIEHADWLARLPATIGELERRWSLALGEPFDNDETSCAWVAPVETPDGTPAVLKVALPHFEAEHEIAGLRFWQGDPTVRLIDADEDLCALLLERCDPGTHLRAVLSEPEQDEVIAGLLRRIQRAPASPHPFRPLAALVARWSDETRRTSARSGDPGLVREGLRLFDELPRTAGTAVLLATDLHAGNVLRARREGWLVIDPKPFVGDPAYDATQHLLNGLERLRAQPLATVRRLAELAGVDPERVRAWTFARLAAEPRDDIGSLEGQFRSEVARSLAP